jgi:hypothetical protein
MPRGTRSILLQTMGRHAQITYRQEARRAHVRRISKARYTRFAGRLSVNSNCRRGNLEEHTLLLLYKRHTSPQICGGSSTDRHLRGMSVSVSRGAFRPRRKMKLCAYNSMHLAPDASAVPTDCEIAKRHFPPRLPETVNRVETHATHRKQTTAHTSTRDVPAHDFFRQSFADHSATRNPCRAKDRGATFKSRCFAAEANAGRGVGYVRAACVQMLHWDINARLSFSYGNCGGAVLPAAVAAARRETQSRAGTSQYPWNVRAGVTGRRSSVSVGGELHE